MPKVSVVIPNYNHFPFLKQRLHSVLHQTFTDFEVIVLDDCSTDNSREIIEQYRAHGKVSVIEYNKINSGSPFIQWAKGIELAKGEYVWIAESDDWCEVSYLEEVMQYAHTYPSAGLFYSKTLMVKGDETYSFDPVTELDHLFYQGAELLKKRLINGLSINNASAVVFKRKKALLHLPQLIQYKKHGDYFFWISLANEVDAVFVNKPLNFCRILETSVTRLAFKKDVKSLTEHIAIFKLLVSYTYKLSFKAKLLFYDCWGLRFIEMLESLDISHTFKYYYLLFSKSNFNIYFGLRLIYFKFRQTSLK